ncbi:EAL domain-containing protein [Thiorhodococcus fuscus]|uniref:EAL domain-containing protein n=1 Tax=Thiorhodococcus fuscus TaxID=527200 RepID=A0ABW4YCA7_9GAMM
MTPSQHPDEEDALFLIEDQPDELHQPKDSWRILIVDDEPDVHEATVLALRDLTIDAHSLDFLHAYSATQAYSLLAENPDVAVILLDVVMESEDAGLALIQRIREDLDQRAVRIILRTGQPGYAPEIETIRAYDINDYKTKSEMTRVRLFTSLTVAIRSYRQLRQLEMSRRGLELIISASTGLAKRRALHHFAEGVVTHLCALLDIAPEGLVCVASAPTGEKSPWLIAAAGQYRHLIQSPLHELPDAGIRNALEQCLTLKSHLFEPMTCLYFDVQGTQGVAAYLDVAHPLDRVNRNLLEIFCANVTVGFENVLLHEQLVDSAYYDPFLHLPNRARLIQLIDERQDGEQDATLALIDLDDFAEINAALDHHFGDQVLRAVAYRLGEVFQPPILIARVTADAFCLLGPSAAIDRHAIEQIFATPFDLQDRSIRISATASLIRLGPDPTGGADLLKDASIALKQAKRLHRGRAIAFTEDLGLAARERIRLLTDLRSAFHAEQLHLTFQPLVDLATGAPVGAEALLRWTTEEGHSIPPDRFIPMAEHSGLMIALGEWVLRTACDQLKRLVELGYTEFRMAVNVSQAQFREPDFVSILERVLQEHEIDPERIELELTESIAIGQIASTAAKIAEIRRMGVSVALDDFGTGYSSLSVLKQLGVDRIKIDRAFVQELGHSGDSGIADLVVALGRQMDLGTIAEGVETEEQRRYLMERGCQDGQGYLFGRPMSSDAFEAWMADRT